MRAVSMVIVLAMVAALGSCVRVKPYQREQLAHPCMTDAPWPQIDRADQHVQEVREGTAGATGNPGGGCGCN